MLKNRSKFSNSIRTDLYERLRLLSKISRIPISLLLDEAVELLLKEHKQK